MKINNTTQCKRCKRNYKMVNEKTGLCYHCYVEEYHTPPKEWINEEKIK